MPYAVELYFDMESSKKIDEIRKNLEFNGILIDKGTKPHISLTIYDDFEMPRVEEEIYRFSKEIEPFHCSLSSIGLFMTEKPVLFLKPVVTMELLQIHSNFHERFKKYSSKVWRYYLPGIWVPHCTLVMDDNYDAIYKALSICREISMPIKARFESIGLLEFKPNKQLLEYRLGKNPEGEI